MLILAPILGANFYSGVKLLLKFQTMKKGIIISVIALVIIGFGVFLSTRKGAQPAPPQDRFSKMSSRELALLCEPQEYVVMHIHPTLKIIIDRQLQPLPANVGIEGVGGFSYHS